MVVNYLFLIFCLLTSCSFPEPSRKETAEERFDRERDEVVYRALNRFIKSMQAKGYRAAGIGEGLDHSGDREKEKQNYLEVTFDIECLPSIDFARQVEVEALQTFQKYINEEEGIQDYVVEYPFPIKFLNIAFISKIRDKDLCMVSNFREEIYYCKDEPGKPLQGPLIEVHSESYEDAVRILSEQPHIVP
ncbi:MAG: hypothetical protein JJU12_02905 [Chlamydiales bacterium]|nr:hypothetical protein [Chlamydiales bacterium]